MTKLHELIAKRREIDFQLNQLEQAYDRVDAAIDKEVERVFSQPRSPQTLSEWRKLLPDVVIQACGIVPEGEDIQHGWYEIFSLEEDTIDVGKVPYKSGPVILQRTLTAKDKFRLHAIT